VRDVILERNRFGGEQRMRWQLGIDRPFPGVGCRSFFRSRNEVDELYRVAGDEEPNARFTAFGTSAVLDGDPPMSMRMPRGVRQVVRVPE
jgi:hypothetical protein